MKTIIKLDGNNVNYICSKCRKVIKSDKFTSESVLNKENVNCKNCKTKTNGTVQSI